MVAAQKTGSACEIVRTMIDGYNAHDAERYVAFMTDDVLEANYLGSLLRRGRAGVKSGTERLFLDFPDLRVEILQCEGLGNFVVSHEMIFLGAKVGEVEAAEPFPVVTIYAFENNKVSRVEFVR